MTLELNNHNIKSKLIDYYQQLEYNQPYQSISHLFQDKNYIQKIYYLYDHFTKNSSIKNKRKRLILVQLFHNLVQNKIQTVFEQCQGINETIINEIVMKIINVPVIIVNFDPSKNRIVQTYREVINKMNVLGDNLKLNIINRLVVLGQQSLLFQQNNDGINKIIKKKFSSITKNYKILIHLIKNNNQLFQQIIESFDDRTKQVTMQKMLFSQQLKPSHALILNSIKLSDQYKMQHLTTLLSTWADNVFFNQTPYVQKLLTNYISLRMKSMSKDYLQSVMIIVNQGITQRFQYSKSFQFIKQSAMIIWKTFAKGLDLEQSIQNELQDISKVQFFEDDKDICEKDSKPILIISSQTIKKVSIPTTSHTNQQIQQKIKTDSQQYSFKPKNLYDCYLGLTSDNYKRKQSCLKAIPTLVRTQESDLIFNSSKILNVLLFLHDQASCINDFSKLRRNALTSLIVYQPIESIKVMTDRFYNKQCCLADKIMILSSINESVSELNDNPQKYKVQQQKNQQQFYFKKVTSKYYKEEDKIKKQKQIQRLQKLDEKSRRWGHTKKAHELLKISNTSSTLVPMGNKQLLINDTYVNRLYEIVDEIFFTFVYKIVSLDHLFNDITFMDCLFGTLNVFIGSIQNYYKKYRIIEQVIDILSAVKSKSPQIIKGKLGVVLKMVSIFDKNINYQQLLLLNLQDILKQFYDFQKINNDPSIHIMLGIVQERLGSFMNSIWRQQQPSSKSFILSLN